MQITIAVVVTIWKSAAFTFHQFNRNRTRPSLSYKCTTTSTSLGMALTPVGPFCPFRSPSALEIEPQMESLNTGTPDFATEMARIQLDMQVGQTPDPERLNKVATAMNEAVDNWEGLVDRLRSSNDFQTREYGKLTQAHLARNDQTSDDIVKMMRWQSGCLTSMAENKPPPLPPDGVDIMKMMEEAKNKQVAGKEMPSMTAMAAAEKINTTPFKGDEPAFDSETVRAEYEALCRDHASLVDMGASYGTFDPIGKLYFLDQVDTIEERWDIFFARFSLLGQLNQAFVEQCNAFLSSMGLDEPEFRDLLKATHQLMREDAEKERNIV